MTENNCIDVVAEAKESKDFAKYSQEAYMKIRIAEEVFAAREKMGLSQQSLSKIVGTTQRIISAIENGDVNPGTYLMFRISKALDFDICTFARIYDCPIKINQPKSNYVLKEKRSEVLRSKNVAI